jgi:hypothetical protein
VLKDVAATVGDEGAKRLLRWVEVELHRRWHWWRNRRFLKWANRQLDEVVRDATPCFDAKEITSFEHIFYNANLPQTGDYRRLHDLVRVVSAWFLGWERTRRAIGARLSPKTMLAQLEELNALIFYASETGLLLREALASLPSEDREHGAFKILADRYDDFLREYDKLLRRLPHELGKISKGPPVGNEFFFRRLGRVGEREHG